MQSLDVLRQQLTECDQSLLNGGLPGGQQHDGGRAHVLCQLITQAVQG